LAIFEGIRRFASEKPSAIIATVLALILVPSIMAMENWDDHDRSGKYVTLDWAKNYLNSCEPNAILVTNGDNDTFPLWYAQEVEGIRTDVRVVNYMLASGYWYIQQMMEKKYDSEGIPLNLSKEQYGHGTNMYMYVQNMIKEYTDVRDIFPLVKNEDKRLEFKTPDGEVIHIWPSSNLKLIVASADVVSKHAVPTYLQDQIVDEIKWEIKGNAFYKNDLFLLDMIASNNWERPIYFVSPSSVSKVFNIVDYSHLTGTVYRLLPVKAKHMMPGMGGIDPIQSFESLNSFEYGNLSDPDVYIDRETTRSMRGITYDFIFVAEALLDSGEKEKAVTLLNRFFEAFPTEKFPPDIFMIQVAGTYADAGAPEESKKLLKVLVENYTENIDYINSLDESKASQFEEQYREALGGLQRILMVTQENSFSEIQKSAKEVFDREISSLE
jgi:hypothetical protein